MIPTQPGGEHVTIYWTTALKEHVRRFGMMSKIFLLPFDLLITLLAVSFPLTLESKAYLYLYSFLDRKCVCLMVT